LKKLRVLKFDAFYPVGYLTNKKNENKDLIENQNYHSYYNWLISLRSYLSDYFSYHMNENGWECREVFAHDSLLLKKLVEDGEIKKVSGVYYIFFIFRFIFNLKLKQILNFPNWKNVFLISFQKEKKEWLLEQYINTYNPDILFIREPSIIDGLFWNRFKGKKFIVSLIGCNTSHAINWYPHRNDMIISLTPSYQQFFKLQNIPSICFEYGIEERIFDELPLKGKNYDITFVGLLGSADQVEKSKLLNEVAAIYNFKWWGPKGAEIDEYPALIACWQGQTSGIDMFSIYHQSKIVINDYVGVAEGLNVNMRTKEVLQVGSFLLTRSATNILHLENEKVLAIFEDTPECIRKIGYYLINDKEREDIAANGRKYAIQNFSYSIIIKNLMAKIEQEYTKFNCYKTTGTN
jgi:hypothetical protein